PPLLGDQQPLAIRREVRGVPGSCVFRDAFSLPRMVCRGEGNVRIPSIPTGPAVGDPLAIAREDQRLMSALAIGQELRFSGAPVQSVDLEELPPAYVPEIEDRLRISGKEAAGQDRL